MIPYAQGKRDLSPWCPCPVSIPDTWHQGCTAWAAAPVQGISPLPKIPWHCQDGLQHQAGTQSCVKMLPQALSASRRCRDQPDQPALSSSLGFLSLPALIESLQFLLVKALLIPAKPAVCRAWASDHFPARRWLCGHVPKSIVPSGRGSHSPAAVICWPVIFTWLNDKE